MKVVDIMSKEVDYVGADTPVKEVTRIIFGRGINGVPVCKGRKVVGFITERDILNKFFPSMQEYMEDIVHSANFEDMEKKVDEIFSLKASAIMSKNPTVITGDSPLLRAQSLMTIHKIGRLPVVDGNGNLIGIVTKGDIFKTLVGDRLPFSGDEEYHDWLSRHYDLVVNWKERLGHEIPDLTKLFRKERLENILDIGCGTGEHDIALAQKGFSVLGMERSGLMFKSAMQKLNTSPKNIKERLKFLNGDYLDTLKKQTEKFGAVIFMGNAFSHLFDNYKDVLKASFDALYPKNSLMVFQIINYEKVFKVKKRFLDFNFKKSKLGIEYEHGFLEFYDPPKRRGGHLTLNMAIFDYDGKKWKFRSMNSLPIVPFDKEKINSLLKDQGFSKISFYGGSFLGSLFKDPFDPLTSDWLNVVAMK